MSSTTPPATTADFSHLLPPTYKTTITSWLTEDTPSLDYGGFVVGTTARTATLYAKSPGLLAGTPWFTETFAQLSCTVTWHYPEGTFLSPTTPIAVATVSGAAKDILLGERVALNTLSRCSGIATASHDMVALARNAGYTGIIAGTRKTTPGFRLVEKYGMLVGGADPHRYDLSSMVMLKDNHIWSHGSITKAVAEAKRVGGFAVKVEVECGTFEEACEAVEAGAEVVMLDNFTGEGLRVCAGALREKFKGRGVLLECSGGLTLENVEGFVCNGECGGEGGVKAPEEVADAGRYRYHLDERDPSGGEAYRLLAQDRSLGRRLYPGIMSVLWIVNCAVAVIPARHLNRSTSIHPAANSHAVDVAINVPRSESGNISRHDPNSTARPLPASSPVILS